MDIERRSGAPSAFAWLLGLSLGAACMATVACSSNPTGSGSGGWPTSGGVPLGGGTGGGTGGTGGGANQSTGGSSGAGTSSGGTGGGGAGLDAGTPVTPVDDAGSASPESGAGGGGGDGGGNHDGGLAADGGTSPAGDGAAPAFTFTLVDTTITGLIDGSPVAGFDPIADGSTIILATTGTALSIRANLLPAGVGSVGFAVDATYTHTENTTPYMLCGDNGAGTITSCANVLVAGKHTLTATPYSAAALGGTAGTPSTITFTIQ